MDRFYKEPIFKYQGLLLHNLTAVYEAKKSKQLDDWTRFSNLLIDKFAIHSATLFHLFFGIIQHEDSNSKFRKVGFDLFTVNSLIRAIMETYVTFNHVFVLPRTEQEAEFRFLLWQLDGFIEKRKFRIEKSDFELAESIGDSDQKTVANLTNQLIASAFAKNLGENQLNKLITIKESKVKRTSWRFLHKNGEIRPLTIIELIEYSCPARAFYNLYRYSSMHTHSGYVSVEQFEKVRGQIISDQYADTLIRMSIYITIFLIKDICAIDKGAATEYLKFSQADKDDIDGANRELREKLTADDTYSQWRHGI